MATLDQLLLTNRIFQEWAIPKTSEIIQNLRYSVIWKNGDLVNVIKSTKPFAVKRRPQISNTDLSPFEEPHTLPIFETKNIIKAGKVFCKKVDQRGGRVIGSFYAFREAALIFLQISISDENGRNFEREFEFHTS